MSEEKHLERNPASPMGLEDGLTSVIGRALGFLHLLGYGRKAGFHDWISSSYIIGQYILQLC